MRRKDRIPKMKPKELRSLAKKIGKTKTRVSKLLRKRIRQMYETQASLKKLNRLEDRVSYWLGKAKALKCPAYKHTGFASCKCMVKNQKYAWSMRWTFTRHCYRCKLTKKEAMKKATFNGVFKNY